jgi:hypothetical protein
VTRKPKVLFRKIASAAKTQTVVVWITNTLCTLLLLFTITLSSDDAVTRTITCVGLLMAFAAAYVSVRVRFGVVSLLLLLISAYLNLVFWGGQINQPDRFIETESEIGR